MAAIWHNDGSGWHTMAPSGFPDEAALHTLIEDAPQSLPLIEQLIAPAKVGQGSYAPLLSDALLDALTAAYREATSK